MSGYPELGEDDHVRPVLQASLQVLALDAEAQLASLPDIAAKADELAMEFGDAYLLVRNRDLVAPDALEALTTLDRHLEQLSGPDPAGFWTEEGVRADARWETIRGMARDALAACGWTPIGPGPFHGRNPFEPHVIARLRPHFASTGRWSRMILGPRYRPHAVPAEDLDSARSDWRMLGVCGVEPPRTLRDGVDHEVVLAAVYWPRVDYRPLTVGTPFALVEGHEVVARGRVIGWIGEP